MVTGSWGAAGWQLPVRTAIDDTRLLVAARWLAVEFSRFSFGVCETRDHAAIVAERQDRDVPGVYAIITDDVGEMLQALRDDEEDSPPGGWNGLPGDPGG